MGPYAPLGIYIFVWKPSHFEFRVIVVAWYKLRLRLLQIIHFLIFSHFRSLSVRKSACVKVFWFSSDYWSARKPKYVQDVYAIFCLKYWRTKEVHQHGGFTVGSIILCGTFWWISQLWDNTYTLNAKNCLYLLSIILRFLDFIHWMVLDFIFYCMTMNTLYKENFSRDGQDRWVESCLLPVHLPSTWP